MPVVTGVRGCGRARLRRRVRVEMLVVHGGMMESRGAGG